jgi:hypothetical protein
MPNPIDATLRASTAVTASGVGASVDLLGSDALVRRAAWFLLECTALSGTLTCSVQTSPSGSSWKDIGRFTPLVDVGYERVTFCPVERYARVKWSLADGAAATFSAIGQAEVIYADLEDFYRFGLPRVAIQDLKPADTVAAALLSASTVAEEAIPSRYRSSILPNVPYILRQRVCEFAIGSVLGVRGYDVDDAADKAAIDRYTYARDWFEKLATGQLQPPWIPEDAEEEPLEAGGYALASELQRGW